MDGLLQSFVVAMIEHVWLCGDMGSDACQHGLEPRCGDNFLFISIVPTSKFAGLIRAPRDFNSLKTTRTYTGQGSQEVAVGPGILHEWEKYSAGYTVVVVSASKQGVPAIWPPYT